jgi:hypothetical protein
MRFIKILVLLVALPVLAIPATVLAQANPEQPAQAEPAKPTPEPPATPESVTPESSEQGSDGAAQNKSEVQSKFVNGTLDTLPRDPNYGQRSAGTDQRFQTAEASLAAVDRRRQITSMPDRNILAPMAQTPAEGTVSYSNFNILGNYLTYAPTDKLAVTAGMVIPSSDADFITSVSGKYKLYESRDWMVSVLPFGAYSNGNMDVDTYQFGLGSGLLADFYVTDTIIVTGGALGFATLAAGYDRYSDDCTRSEFGDNNCAVETTGLTLPAGGHWMAATLGANWYITQSFAFNLEYILGGSWGTFFGVEDGPEGNDLASRRDRFEDPEFAAGIPHGYGSTLSMAGTWSNGTAGLQLAVMLVGNRDNPNTLVIDESQSISTLPMLSGAFNF